MDCNDDPKELSYNVSIIKALLQFFPTSDQSKIQDWLTKIQDQNNGLPDMSAINEYLLFLLINLQNGILIHPFDKSPPQGKLKPLSKILPDYVYEDLKNQFNVSSCKLKKTLQDDNENYEVPDLKCKPSNFHSEQPRPPRGVTASLAVFSNYDDNV